MKTIATAGMVVMSLLMSACGNNEVNAIRIMHKETLDDGSMGLTRTLITPDYMRLDNGKDEDGFILLDRKKNIVYSVNDSDQLIVRIDKRDVDIPSPIPLNWKEHISTEHGFTYKTFQDKPVKEYSITVDNKLCFVSYFVPGFLPDAAAAEKQYLDILASDNRRVLKAGVPEDTLDACDLVINDFHAGSHLHLGYPLGVSDGRSYRRYIESFNEHVKVAKSLFVLPKGYRLFTPETISPLTGPQ